jgi:predicted phosphodiesterase
MIWITGDTHKEKKRLSERALRKLKKGDTLIVLGDFGFVWDGSEKERKFLDNLGRRKYNICFIDGTHENFDRLETRFRETLWNGGLVHRISGNCFHLCRGQIFNIEGLSVFTFGGGESEDKDMRLEGKTWWRQELPTNNELMAGAKALDAVDCKVDVILTHEPPSKIKTSMLFREKKEERINKLNTYFEEINSSCKFKKWYFGSMHTDKQITRYHTCVYEELIPLNTVELHPDLL